MKLTTWTNSQKSIYELDIFETLHKVIQLLVGKKQLFCYDYRQKVEARTEDFHITCEGTTEECAIIAYAFSLCNRMRDSRIGGYLELDCSFVGNFKWQDAGKLLLLMALGVRTTSYDLLNKGIALPKEELRFLYDESLQPRKWGSWGSPFVQVLYDWTT